MFAILTVQIRVEDDNELQDRIEELENMGFSVNVEYEAEDEELDPLPNDLEEVEFDKDEEN